MWFEKTPENTPEYLPDVVEIAPRLEPENVKVQADVSRFSTMLNASANLIWEHDEHLDISYANLRYSELVEASAGGGEGGAIPALDRRQRQLAEAALSDGQPKRERRYLVVGGERKLYELDAYPVSSQCVVGFGRDISEIDALEQEVERYRSAQSDFLESSTNAMAIYGPDKRLSAYNYAFAALWKLDEGWLDGQPSYGEILEELRENRKLPEQANFKLFKEQQVGLFTSVIEPREEFFYLPDGRTLRVIAISHALGGVLFAYEDVTDRLALERSYNTLIAVQRETLDHLHEGVAVFGEDGRLKLYNPTYLQLWQIDDEWAATGPHINDIVDRVRTLYIFDNWDAFKAGRIAQIQSRKVEKYRVERKDESIIDCSTVPLPDGQTLITYIDMSDSIVVERSLRERNDALQEADRLKSEFLANVSYELRSPLTSIAGFSDMLQQEYFGKLSQKQLEYVHGIYQSSQQLMHLVNDILDLASLEAGYMQLDVDSFDITKMLYAVTGMIEERARNHRMDIAVKCEDHIGEMDGDERRIKQVLFNLLTNSVRFCDEGSRVELGARADGDRVLFWVADNGPGIPESEQPYIFEKFYKGRNEAIPKARAKSGTGLGLSIVKNFVELHGGTITLDSAPGETRFTCVFVRHVEAESD